MPRCCFSAIVLCFFCAWPLVVPLCQPYMPDVLIHFGVILLLTKAKTAAMIGQNNCYVRDLMSGMDERRNTFENKFAHDEDLRFRAIARRNKLLGLWAAEKLGKTGADAQAYATEVVRADFEEAGDEDVIRKVAGDFSAASVNVSDDELRLQLLNFLEEAAKQVSAE